MTRMEWCYKYMDDFGIDLIKSMHYIWVKNFKLMNNKVYYSISVRYMEF
jgi:hypothetical protein